ncbi:MAG: MFS transporter [Deltaproteobacteria bacterium]|nr:MFS transporter [Deltaproteobacteria bacterium]
MKNPRGTLAVIGSAGAIFWPGAFIFGYPGVMGPLWQQQFGVGRGEIGNTLFFVLAAVGIFMFFVGRWQERWGTRRMILWGAVLFGGNQFLIAFADRLWLVYLWAFLNGATASFIYIPGLTAVQRWFPQKRGLVSGIVNLVYGLSAAVMSPLFGYLQLAFGYQSMNLLLASTALITGTLAAWGTASPNEVSRNRSWPTPPTGPPPPPAGPAATVAESLRSPSFWFLWCTWAFQGAAGIALVTLAVPFGLARLPAPELAVLILTAFNLTNGLSRLIMGYFSDKFSRTGGMSLTFLAAGIAYLLLPRVSGLPVILLLAAVIGFAFGTLFAVSAPLTVDCFGIKHFGAVYGLVFTAYGFLSGAIGPSLSGYLLDATGADFSIVFSYLGIFCLISSFMIRRVRPVRY